MRAITAFPHYPAWRVSAGYTGWTIHDNLDGVPVTRVRPYMPSNPSGLKRLAVEIVFGVRSAFVPWGKPDVVVLVSPALFAVMIAIARARLSRARPRVIVWVQDLYSLGVSETGALSGFGARVMTWFEKRILLRADTVVAIHHRFKRYIVEALGVNETKVKVVRNWTHLAPIVVDRAEYRERFGWTDEIIVLHAGNMGAKQALESVVEAARIADAENLPVQFVLLGDGNQRSALRELAEGIRHLTFMDSLNDRDFQGALSAADLLLVNEKPGVTEMAVPSKLTSYFSARRPIIAASDAGSITAGEIESAAAGIRVDAGDPRALLEGAIQLAGDRDLSARLGENGYHFYERELSPESALSRYADIINSLAK
jgi:colanic acid biosynthesis glycosyl transferase WcaI